ncbi:uncharacterized protein LOC124153400 [Ischnura elegans]|uniref:uncharacterized protein LOC124153400 n=1 Tax=Ischnura elegans TaxID=197161 RepID=UPI001ED88C4F|nr:uncharacterized protein LOC124153400 [Ischnura elegans]XP_046382486.1 uncharacterized protein LOC124153400 [Ischnura elegans]
MSQKNTGGKMSGMNNNHVGKLGDTEQSKMEQDGNRIQTGASHKFTEWQSPNDYGDGNGDIFDLQRLAMENRKSPFPDFQFDILENEADTDDNGCDYNVATGTRKKSPTRMDSWEDNWLFQQKKSNSRGSDGGSTLMSMRMYDTIDEQRNQDKDDCEEEESDASDYSDNCRSRDAQRVERPCVRTSSSSSDEENSDESESMDSHSRTTNSNEDDKVPFLESNPSTPANSDTTDSNGQSSYLEDHEEVKDMPSNGQNITKKNFGKMLQTQAAEDIDSDDSINNELRRCEDNNASYSQSVKQMLPKFLVEKCYSPRPVSGTKSCTSEDSSSDEFEKKAAAYKGRRRASWCPLDTPASTHKRGKRRAPLLPLQLDDDDHGQEMKPPSSHAEALVGLERQMLHRDAHHSSFRAKKASPNFVLNPLYIPEGEGGQNPRPPDLLDEPNAIEQHLRPSKSESGYSSCSPDSMANQNNMNFPQQGRRFDMEARHDPPSPAQRQLQPQPNVRPSDPDSSFLW